MEEKMELLKECRFCNILNGIYKYQDIDKPILETKEYSMICSVGSFIPGWSLIVPKKHEYSMRKHYNSQEFFNFFYKVKNLIEKTYGVKMIAFEHGANRPDSLTSCGTCHSHLHIVPFKDSILNDINKDYDWIDCNFNEITQLVQDKEYLLYVEILDNIEASKCYLHILEEETSQYFRKVLANHIGYFEDYSYKTNLLLDKTNQSVQKYRGELKNKT